MLSFRVSAPSSKAMRNDFSAPLLSLHTAYRATSLGVPANSVGHFGAYLRTSEPVYLSSRCTEKHSRRAVGVQYVAVRQERSYGDHKRPRKEIACPRQI
jgi:hypothetical protein